MPLRTSYRWVSLALMAWALTACGGTSAETPQQTASDSESPASSASAAPTLRATIEEADEQPAGAIEVLLTDDPGFDPDELTAKAGDLVFFLRSDQANQGIVHNFFLGTDVHAPPLAKGPTLLRNETAVFTVYGIEPGTYTYWCSVPGRDGQGHWYNGMIGTLTVTE